MTKQAKVTSLHSGKVLSEEKQGVLARIVFFLARLFGWRSPEERAHSKMLKDREAKKKEFKMVASHNFVNRMYDSLSKPEKDRVHMYDTTRTVVLLQNELGERKLEIYGDSSVKLEGFPYYTQLQMWQKGYLKEAPHA